MAERYTRHMNDRREGRQLYTLPAYARIQPYILRRRSDAACFLSDSVEVTGVEKWLREKRAGGWANLGFLHLIIAAYVRTVSMRPGINRFVSGRRIYARNDIEVVLPVKRSASVTATETSIKVRFAPTDTVFDVYRKLTEATDEVRADISLSAPEKLANTLMRFPRVLLRMAMSIFRRFSICSSSLVAYWIRVSLLTPSTRSATVGEVSLATSSYVASVSSMTS